MNPLYIGATVTLAIATASLIHINKTTTSIYEKKAREIIEAKENLKEKITIEKTANNGALISFDAIIDTGISNTIVPAIEYSKHDMLNLNKYQRAVKQFYETNDLAVTPTCTDLNTTQIITFEDCTKLESINFNFFEYTADKIAFSVENTIANIIVKLDKNIQVVENNGTHTSFLDSEAENELVTYQMNQKQKHETKLQQQIDELMEKDIVMASALNNKMLHYNSTSALNNAARITKSIDTLTLDETKRKKVALDSAKLIADYEVLNKQSGITTEANETIHTASITDIKNYISTKLDINEQSAVVEERKEYSISNSDQILKKIRTGS